jgi:hypothetical protein
MNISGTLNVFKLLRDPTLCLPQATVSTFNHLPIPLSKAFDKNGEKKVDIRAVILDKDNCFAVPHANEVYEQYNVCIIFDIFPHESRLAHESGLCPFRTTCNAFPQITYIFTGKVSNPPRSLSGLKTPHSFEHSRHLLRQRFHRRDLAGKSDWHKSAASLHQGSSSLY